LASEGKDLHHQPATLSNPELRKRSTRPYGDHDCPIIRHIFWPLPQVHSLFKPKAYICTLLKISAYPVSSCGMPVLYNKSPFSALHHYSCLYDKWKSRGFGLGPKLGFRRNKDGSFPGASKGSMVLPTS
jgi:hypothetical protein